MVSMSLILIVGIPQDCINMVSFISVRTWVCVRVYISAVLFVFQVIKEKSPAGPGDSITSLPISIPLSTVHPSKLPVSIPLSSVVLPSRAERLVCVCVNPISASNFSFK